MVPASVLLVLGLAATEGEDGAVEKRTDDLGRVVYSVPAPAHEEADLDLLPTPVEELKARLRGIPSAWTPTADVPFAEIIREGSSTFGVDPALLEAVMAVESAFNPFAVSRAGAIGLMQLMPGTAARYGVSDIYDPRENVMGGARYLAYLWSLFDGDVDLVLAAYNAGENAVIEHGGIPPYPETRVYVQRVRRYLERLRTGGAGAQASLTPARAASPSWLLRPSPPAAPIYHYVDDRGVVHFTNVKPPDDVGKVHVWKPGK